MSYEDLREYFAEKWINVGDVLFAVDSLVQAGVDTRMAAQFVGQMEDREVRDAFPTAVGKRLELLLSLLGVLKDGNWEYEEDIDFR